MHDPARILRTPEVARRLGISRASLWRWHSEGHFIPPRILGQGTKRPAHGWLESDVNAWLEARPTLARTAEPGDPA